MQVTVAICTAPGLGPGQRVPARDLVVPLVLVVSSCGACVREDLAEVVEEVDRGTTSAEPEVGGGQQRAVLRVAAEVGGRAGQVVAEPPHAAVITLLVRGTVLERTEERVEGRRGALVGGRDQGAAGAGEPVAGVNSILGRSASKATREYWTLSPGPVRGLENRVDSGCKALLPSGQTGWYPRLSKPVLVSVQPLMWIRRASLAGKQKSSSPSVADVPLPNP